MPLSPYVQMLRAKIGHDLLLMQSVTVFLFDHDGRVLLAQDRASGLWMTVGGAIEPDERPADAAVREVWEETGLLITPVRLLGVLGGPAFRVTYANGDVVSYVVTVFEGQIRRGRLRPDGDETAALRFVSREEAAALPMAPWTHELVQVAFAPHQTPYFAPATWQPT